MLAEKRLMDQNPDLSKMAIEDRLCAQKQKGNEKKHQMKMDCEAHQCDHSFHPQLSDASVIIALSKRPNTLNNNKWDELYNDKDRFNKNNKRDLRHDEKELMKNGDEYTFQPY